MWRSVTLAAPPLITASSENQHSGSPLPRICILYWPPALWNRPCCITLRLVPPAVEQPEMGIGEAFPASPLRLTVNSNGFSFGSNNPPPPFGPGPTSETVTSAPFGVTLGHMFEVLQPSRQPLK